MFPPAEKRERGEAAKKFGTGKWDYHGWMKMTFGEQERATQTKPGDFKQKAGDNVITSKSRWFPVKKDKNAIKDPMLNVREIGVGTEDMENYFVKKDKPKAVGKGVRAEPQLKEVKPIDADSDRVASPSQVEVTKFDTATITNPYVSAAKGKGPKNNPNNANKSGNSLQVPYGRQDTDESSFTQSKPKFQY